VSPDEACEWGRAARSSKASVAIWRASACTSNTWFFGGARCTNAAEVTDVLRELDRNAGFLFDADGMRWFRSTDLGDFA